MLRHITMRQTLQAGAAVFEQMLPPDEQQALQAAMEQQGQQEPQPEDAVDPSTLRSLGKDKFVQDCWRDQLSGMLLGKFPSSEQQFDQRVRTALVSVCVKYGLPAAEVGLVIGEDIKPDDLNVVLGSAGKMIKMAGGLLGGFTSMMNAFQ